MTGSPQPSMRFLNFLAARLDEDEQVAWAVQDNSSPWTGQWQAEGDAALRTYNGHVLAYRPDGSPFKPGVLAHMARHDPARALREVEAKRKIMKRHFRRRLPDWDREGQVGFECAQCLNEFPCLTLQLLAEPYSGHADYQPEWRPRP